MTSTPKPILKQSVKQVGPNSQKIVNTVKPLGQLKAKPAKARKVQDVADIDMAHSRYNADKSKDYHGRVLGTPKPFNNSGLPTSKNDADKPQYPRDPKAEERVKIRKAQEKMTSKRPGRTAQRGLGG
jgi:hypothetical protein